MKIVPFAFGTEVVRTAGTPEAPLFCAADVCACLELKNQYSSLALIPAEEKALHEMEGLGGKQQMVFVTEPGLFRLVIKSRKASAVKFQDWLFREVLPAIRKTGSYSVPGAAAPALPAGERPLMLAPRYVLPEWPDEMLVKMVPFGGVDRQGLQALLMRALEVDMVTAEVLIREALANKRLRASWLADYRGGEMYRHSEMLHRGDRLPPQFLFDGWSKAEIDEWQAHNEHRARIQAELMNFLRARKEAEFSQ